MKKRLGLLLGLVLVAGLVGVAACPSVGLPVAKVDAIGGGNYIVWVQNTTTCNVTTIKVFLMVPTTTFQVLPFGPAATATGAGSVWTIQIAAPGLKPGGLMLLGLKGVSPVVPGTCEALVKYLFVSPPCLE